MACTIKISVRVLGILIPLFGMDINSLLLPESVAHNPRVLLLELQKELSNCLWGWTFESHHMSFFHDASLGYIKSDKMVDFVIEDGTKKRQKMEAEVSNPIISYHIISYLSLQSQKAEPAKSYYVI